MAKRIADEEMRFTVIINGDEAQVELHKLDEATRKLIARNKELKEEKAKLVKLGLEESARYKELTLEIQANERAIDKNAEQMKNLQDQIGVTSLSMRQLNSRARALRAQLHHMVPGSAEFTRLQAELAETNARIKALRTSAVATKMSLNSLADGFNKYAALGAAAIAAGTGVALSIQKMIDYNGKLSDSMANVMKTTSMNRKEVDELAKSFGMFETRTGRIDLLKIAEEGGRIGLAKEEIGEFVEVMDKAAVALGDSFTGGVEEVASSLGKLKLLYAETKNQGVEEAYMAIGSAINDLGASGVATERNIAEFATRVGALPEAIKPSIAEALALGAAFEESGISAEIAGRGYQILITGAAQNAAKFAQVMNLTTQEVKDFINEDPLEFMVKFAKGMNGMNATETANTLQYLGINADGASKLIGALSNNTEVFRRSIDLANNSMKEGTSLLNEFEIKNSTLAATLDKIGKRIASAFSTETFIGFLGAAINWFAKFIGATEDSTGGVTRFRDALVFLLKIAALVAAAMVTNVAWLKLVALWSGNAAKQTILYTAAKKAQVIATEAAYAASQLYAAATMFLTGNIKGATQAIRVLSATMKTTPWGLVVGLVSVLVTAYIAFSEETKKAATAQSMLNDAIADAQEKTAGQAEKLRVLQAVVEDETSSQEARLQAVKAINKIVPDYNKNLDLSSDALKKGKIAIDQYINSLQKQAEAQFLADQVSIKSKELMAEKNSSIEKHVSWYEQLWNGVKTAGNSVAYMNAQLETGLKNRQKNIELIQEELDAAKSAYKEYIQLNPETTVTEEEFVTTFTPVTGDETSGNNSNKKTKNTSVEDAKSRAAELVRIKEENLKLQASLINDSFQKETLLEENNFQQKLARLGEQLATEAELKAADPKTRDFLLEKNKEINSQIELEELAHNQRLGTILQKGVEDQFNQEQQAYEREKTQRETAHNLELAALGNDEEAKKVLQEKFDQEETARELKHLEDLKSEMQRILDTGVFEGFELDFLSEEEKQRIIDALNAVGLKISEILNRKKELQGGEGIDLGAAGGMDIFGFTADDWLKTFEDMDSLQDKLAGAAMGVGALSNAYATYQQFRALEAQKELREFNEVQKQKESVLKNQLNAGFINERQYNQAIVALEKETEKKRAKLEYESQKRQWEANMSQAVGSAAMAVLNGLQAKPFLPVGIAMGALAGVLGGIQIAMVAKSKPTPAKGFEDGLYPVQREQDGKVFQAAYGGETRSGLVDRPTMFLAGEGGKRRPEMIIDDRAWKQINPDVKDSLNRELYRLGRVPGYEGGYYQEPTVVRSSPEGNNNTADYFLFAAALNRNSDVMERLERQGLPAYLKRSMENARDLKEDIDDYEKFRNSNKI